jgi:hypothetical protein
MILRSKTLLLPSIVLLIGMVFGASATNASATNASATNASATNASATNASATNAFADDPFKNIGGIDDDSFPVGFVDKVKVIPCWLC